MSLISGFPMFKVKIVIPQNSNNFTFPDPITRLDVGRYLIVFPVALVGSNNGTSISFINNISVFADSIGGTTLVATPKTNTNTVDSSGTFDTTPCVIYRNLINTVNIYNPNTPIYIQFLVTLVGETTYGTTTATEDDYYNYIHFVKIA